MTDHDRKPSGTPPGDKLDSLLRRWHDVNAERATAGRDRLIAAMRDERRTRRRASSSQRLTLPAILAIARRTLVNRYSPAVASVMFLVVIAALLMPSPRGRANAQAIMVPDGGRLEALDDEGNLLGPCPLKHTDVDAQVSGFFSRVNVTQSYRNPYQKKIEAVYTFPLSHRAAVDRMTMTVGDRVVEGEVKERQLARQIYEQARASGYVASLLEQERPNIFTQSVANIEPEAEVVVRISYVEVLQSRDGTYTFDFPMVVGPRYIPGAPTVSQAMAPAELKPRPGVILLGPANLTIGAAGDLSKLGSLQGGKLQALLSAAQPVMHPGDTWWGRGDPTGGAGQPQLWYRFEAAYCDGSKELGELHTDGTGQLNGRWFYTDPKAIEGMGTGFNQDTNQVPDASRITPQPVRPGTRAGHDVSVKVTIDAGGPGLLDITSPLHDITRVNETKRDDGLPRVVTLALAKKDEIPNRDFALSWRQTADTIQEAVLTHTAEDLGDWSGGFFTLMLQPPARVEDAQVPPRELVFVMDTSGSMSGFPIEKSKEVMTRAIDSMRAADTFNVITFAGNTAILWQKPHSATAQNRAEAKAFVEGQKGGGGTEMMQAINAALVQGPGDMGGPLSPRQLLDLPADGRAVEVMAAYSDIHVTPKAGLFTILLGDDLDVWLRLPGDLPTVLQPQGVTLRISGRWITENGRRVLAADKVSPAGQGNAAARPLRIALFLTDGYVGNDMAIIDAVQKNASTTRVFSFGIGNSVNRYLLEGMARAGRGEVEFVLLNSEAEEAVNRFTKRIETPVLTDIGLAFSQGLDVLDQIPAPGAIPDLFDAKPLVIHGRYKTPGKGTVTVSGMDGAGPWQRSVELDLPQTQPQHDVIATLWARSKVDEILAPHLQAIQQGAAPRDVQASVVALGERFKIMTQFTSFVAVEKSRMTIGGQPVLVAVPIEMPDGVSYEGVFGQRADNERLVTRMYSPAVRLVTRDGVVNINTAPLALLKSAAAPAAEPAAPEGRRAKREAPGKGPASAGGRIDIQEKSGFEAFGIPSAPGPGAAADAVAMMERAAALHGGGGGSIIGETDEEPRKTEEEKVQEIIDLVTSCVSQDAWDVNGGDLATIRYEDAHLVLEASKPTAEAKDAAERARAFVGYLEERIPELDGIAPVRDGADWHKVLKSDGDLVFLNGEARQDRRATGVYDVRDVVAKGAQDAAADEVTQQLIDLIQMQVDPKGWDVNGGESGAMRAIAGRLIVMAPEPNHLQIKTLISRVRQELGLAPADDESARQAAREARLRRVLDPALLAMIQTPKDQEAALGVPMRQEEALADRGPAPMLLTVLVTDVQKTRKALEEAGLEIVDVSKSLPIIVGTADVSRLASLALVDGVRRIEPTRQQPQ